MTLAYLTSLARMRRFTRIAAAVCAGLVAGGSSSAPKLPHPSAAATLSVTSSSWPAGGTIAARFACHGSDPGHSPAVSWQPGPAGTGSYAVTVVDPDAHDFLHWAV